MVAVTAPILTKEFTDDPVLPGDTVTLEFTLTLAEEAPADVTDLEFTDDLDAVISGLEAVGLPINDVCGTGSQLSGTSVLSLTGGTLAPGTSCTFSATLQVPAGLMPGDSTNTTSELERNDARTGGELGRCRRRPHHRRAQFQARTFTDDPVVPGGVVTLEFSIDNQSATETVTSIDLYRRPRPGPRRPDSDRPAAQRHLRQRLVSRREPANDTVSRLPRRGARPVDRLHVQCRSPGAGILRSGRLS